MLDGSLWLDRYWRQESQVAEELLARADEPVAEPDGAALAASLSRLFPGAAADDQRRAAAVCALSRVSVLAGGPGTGKTTTVAKLLAVLHDQPRPPRQIALAAPTGKAAARLEEAVRSATAELADADRLRLGDLQATTLHWLLGRRPGASSRFKHDRENHLPHDVVVDEGSMMSLTLISRLLDALRPDARLVLVGDPNQLASVEAGAVLGDLVDRGTAHAVAGALDAFAVAYRYSGLCSPYLVPVSHAVRTLPYAGRPPAFLSIRARCRRFQVKKVRLRSVKSLSAPATVPSSRRSP